MLVHSIWARENNLGGRASMCGAALEVDVCFATGRRLER